MEVLTVLWDLLQVEVFVLVSHHAALCVGLKQHSHDELQLTRGIAVGNSGDSRH